MACSADINVSQGSVAIYARCGGTFNISLTTNLPRNLPVKKCFNRLRFDRIMIMSLWPTFLAHPVYGMVPAIDLFVNLLIHYAGNSDAKYRMTSWLII